MANGFNDTIDNMPYMTLSYANGPGYRNHMATNGSRLDPRELETTDNHFQFPAVVPAVIESNGGDDVVVYASGPWAHLFSGSYEQSVIPYMAAYASCIGDGDIAKACDQ